MTRKDRLVAYLKQWPFSRIADWLDSEGNGAADLESIDAAVIKGRYAMIQDGGYVWVTFHDDLGEAGDAAEHTNGFQPLDLIDLDTGEIYKPRITWERG